MVLSASSAYLLQYFMKAVVEELVLCLALLMRVRAANMLLSRLQGGINVAQAHLISFSMPRS